MDKYTVKILESVETKPGCWNYSKVGVYLNDQQIGEYTRNYHTYGESTFFPFIGSNNKWYALYSENYTCTYVMELPSCKKIAGEEPNSFGFCPVEVFVPRYRLWERKAISEENLKNYPEENRKWLCKDEVLRDYEEPTDKDPKGWEENALKETIIQKGDTTYVWKSGIYYDLYKGLVAGCVWGDDSSWKIERLDLSEVHNGKISRSADFGRIELPWNMSLKNSVWVSGDDGEFVRFAIQQGYRLKDNKVVKIFES